jgi:hypothetical protein
MGTDEDRFWAHVDRAGDDECWLWRGAPTAAGYGRLSIRGRAHYAHRLSYEWHHAPIPPGRWIQVCHSCDVKLCVNPRHLWLGTAKSNTAEAIERGRFTTGEQNGYSKLTATQVRELRHRYAAGGVTYETLAAQYGVCLAAISHAVNRRTWAHVD